jgi:uncharacterized protein (DUF2235 family)
LCNNQSKAASKAHPANQQYLIQLSIVFPIMPKRIIVCCDGTWYSADKGQENIPSNVARISRMMNPSGLTSENLEIEQVVFYQSGVGTGALNTIDTITQGKKSIASPGKPWVARVAIVAVKADNNDNLGATGQGLEENVVEAYHFVATNYTSGDEICLFGFSRGAYTARALGGVLTKMGILHKQNLDEFRELYRQFKANGDNISFDPPAEETPAPLKATGMFRLFRPSLGRGSKPLRKGIFVAPEVLVKLKTKPRPVVIKVIGVWDTVGSLGLPDSALSKITGSNKGIQFFDTALNPSKRLARVTGHDGVFPR